MEGDRIPKKEFESYLCKTVGEFKNVTSHEDLVSFLFQSKSKMNEEHTYDIEEISDSVMNLIGRDFFLSGTKVKFDNTWIFSELSTHPNERAVLYSNSTCMVQLRRYPSKEKFKLTLIRNKK